MTRDSFIFYRSFYEAMRDLPRDIQGEIYTAIMEYSLYGNETENLKPIAKSIFILIKPILDANISRYLNGSQGGRPKSETKEKPNDNQNKTEKKPNKDVDVDVDDDVDEKKKEKFNKKTFRENLIGLGADPQHVNDWLLVREKKKAAFTQSAYNRFIKECDGKIEIAEAVRICAQRSWQGFKYEWAKDELKTHKQSSIPNNEW